LRSLRCGFQAVRGPKKNKCGMPRGLIGLGAWSAPPAGPFFGVSSYSSSFWQRISEPPRRLGLGRKFSGFRQLFLDHFAKHVEEQFVAFLNPRGVITGHEQIERGHAFRKAAIPAEETDAFDAPAPGLLQRAQNIFRLAAGGEGDDQIARLGQAPDLARENFVGAVVVAHGGHQFAIGRERNGRIWPAVGDEAAEKFRGQVRGVGRAAAIAADEQLVAGGQAGQNHFCRAIQRFIQTRQGP